MALPESYVLLRARDVDNLTIAQLAATYDVSIEAVEARFEAMGRHIDPAQHRETTELMAAVRRYKATGDGAEDVVRRANRRGWAPVTISHRTGVDIDTVNRILTEVP
jgi:hypothetical protein